MFPVIMNLIVIGLLFRILWKIRDVSPKTYLGPNYFVCMEVHNIKTGRHNTVRTLFRKSNLVEDLEGLEELEDDMRRMLASKYPHLNPEILDPDEYNVFIVSMERL